MPLQPLPPDLNDKVLDGITIPKELSPYFSEMYNNKKKEGETESQFASRALIDYGMMVFAQEKAQEIQQIKTQEAIAEQQALVEFINSLKG